MNITKSVPDLRLATEIAASGFCQPVSTELEQDVAEHLAGGELVYTVHEHEQVVGFAIFNVWDDVLYLSGIILDDEHQRQEAVHMAVRAARSEANGVKYLALRTQSLRMWVAGSRVCQVWFPGPYAESPNSDMAYVGELTAARIGSAFPVGAGCYGGPLYGKKPVYHDQQRQQWWDGICDFDRGDAVICVGVLPETHTDPPSGRHVYASCWV